nr:PDDEXK nuclease domain-containing protein [Curtobacterium flaccumfaciens]
MHFDVDGDDFYVDLLFFHVEQLRYVVIELKTGKFRPEYLGQLGFYVALVDDKLRRPQHADTVGLLLVADKNDAVVRYSLPRRTADPDRCRQLRPPPARGPRGPALGSRPRSRTCGGSRPRGPIAGAPIDRERAPPWPGISRVVQCGMWAWSPHMPTGDPSVLTSQLSECTATRNGGPRSMLA